MWINRRDPLEWPAHSPKLTPSDFFFEVTSNREFMLRNLDNTEHKDRITKTCAKMNPETFELKLFLYIR